MAACSLNLLVGKCKPARVERTRVRSHLCLAATVAAVSVLAALGMSRRAMLERETAAMARRLLGESLASRGPDNADSLMMEVARLRRVVRENARLDRPADASLTLEAVLRAWPTSCAARTQSISVGPGGATIVASVEGEASEFIGSFRPFKGWVMDEPRLNRVDGTTRLTLHLRRAEGVTR